MNVVIWGESLVNANGACAVGDYLQSVASTGKLDTAAAGERAVAVALGAAGAAGDYVKALVNVGVGQAT